MRLWHWLRWRWWRLTSRVHVFWEVWKWSAQYLDAREREILYRTGDRTQEPTGIFHAGPDA